jgi:hypothetical protein
LRCSTAALKPSPSPLSTWTASANQRREHIRKLEDGITELTAHIHAATFRLLEMIREYDECKGWAQPGLRSCAHWLNWKRGIGLGVAREKVRVAHALGKLPQISEAFREGRISFSKVRAMSRVATPENEDYLMMIARHGTASHVERLVRHYRRVQRSEALKNEKRRHDFRELQLCAVEDGSFIIKVRLTPEAGALLKKALEAGMDEDFEEQKNVSAETFLHCVPPTPRKASGSRRRPGFRSGEGKSWTINWRLKRCCGVMGLISVCRRDRTICPADWVPMAASVPETEHEDLQGFISEFGPGRSFRISISQLVNG